MSNSDDFIIENGVLKQYIGPGGDVVIPTGVTRIGDSAFSGCRALKSVTIPESVTSIGDWAFFFCSALKSVTIPESVTSIGDWAFSSCSALKSVTIPAGVTSIGGCVFYECKALKSVTIPDTMTSIGRSAFSDCKALKSVTIPDTMTSIGDSAFSGCRALKSVTIPAGVTSIGKDAFGGCRNLTTIISNVKLSKDVFVEHFPDVFSNPIITNDPGMLPTFLKPLAAIGFAEHPDDPKSERGKTHLKYIKSNAAKLEKEALAHPALLRLLCENKLLKPEVTESYLAAASETGNTDITAMLLDYQQNKLTAKEKEEAAQKAESKEEKVTDFIFSAEALEQLRGKVFVVTGALKSFTREEFKACLDACGAILSETLNEQTDYLITNTPNSGSAKNKKAEALGVKKLSEAEFNRMIGRA